MKVLDRSVAKLPAARIATVMTEPGAGTPVFVMLVRLRSERRRQCVCC